MVFAMSWKFSSANSFHHMATYWILIIYNKNFEAMIYQNNPQEKSFRSRQSSDTKAPLYFPSSILLHQKYKTSAKILILLIVLFFIVYLILGLLEYRVRRAIFEPENKTTTAKFLNSIGKLWKRFSINGILTSFLSLMLDRKAFTLQLQDTWISYWLVEWNLLGKFCPLGFPFLKCYT